MPSGTAVGSNIRYPNLQSIADLFRSGINDTFNNAGGSGTGYGGGAGLIMPNSNPDLLTFMDSAIQEIFSDLRNVGDPELIIDNYILSGIPPLTQANPAVQVSLGYGGYFNGFTWSPAWKLPIGVSKMLRMWERESSNTTSTTVTPLYFRVRGAITSGTAEVSIDVEGTTSSTSVYITGNQIGLVSLQGGTQIDLACDDTFTGTLYFEGSLDGDNWFPVTPFSTTVQLSTTIPLPLQAGNIVSPSSNPGWDFIPMTPAPFGLPGVMQGRRMGWWEMREGAIWMPGCLQYTDLRLRARITYPPFLNPATIDFSTAYVPILDSRNAIVAKMLILYARRFAPDLYPMAISEEDRLMQKLKLEVVRAMQIIENQRAEFGGEAVSDFAISWSWL